MKSESKAARMGTAWALPVAAAVFVLLAGIEFRGLPDNVPVHFDRTGAPDRWMDPRRFIGLMVGLVGGLGILLGFARWIITLPAYDPDGAFAANPSLRSRTLALLDLGGAGGILLITWTAHLCVQASRMVDPVFNRTAVIVPLLVLLGGVAAGLWWLRRAKQRSRTTV
jgi:uncharacterized membrane protein